MARYRVIWLRSVLEVEIARVVVDLMERGQPTEPLYQAMNDIDAMLAKNPYEVGESREEYRRFVVENSLTADYEVLDDENLVVIVRAGYVRPRSDRG